eukprot:g12181.t1
MHLFDIDIPLKITFRESETLTGGKEVSAFAVPPRPGGASLAQAPPVFPPAQHLTAGVAICYDMRFPELSLLLRHSKNAHLLCFPAAFNTVTGPKHWSLCLRARAIDTQCFVLACSPARNATGEGYQAWGHSMIVSPWGEVLDELDENPGVIVRELDFSELAEARKGIPIGNQRREDVYQLGLV